MQKGITRIPLELARLSDEDLVNLDQFRTGSSGSGSNSYDKDSTTVMTRHESVSFPVVEIYTDELENNIDHRGKAYMASKNSVSIAEDSDDVIGSSVERTVSLYCKSSELEKISLEDF